MVIMIMPISSVITTVGVAIVTTQAAADFMNGMHLCSRGCLNVSAAWSLERPVCACLCVSHFV